MNPPSKEATPGELRKIFRASWNAMYAEAKTVARGLETCKQRALECGWTALRAKQLLPHGEFGKWLESCGPDVRRETVWRWMSLAEHYAPQIVAANVARGQHFPALSDPQIRHFLQLTDGKTQRQLELDLGIRPSAKERRIKQGTARAEPEPLDRQVLLAAQRVWESSVFCLSYAKYLTPLERRRLAWAAVELLEGLLPDGEFLHVPPVTKRPRSLRSLVEHHCGARP